MMRRPKSGSILSQKDKSRELEKSRDVFKRKIHFDEQNVRDTHYAMKKDYDFIKVPESKAPYFSTRPVASDELRERIQDAIDRAHKNLHIDNEDDDYVTLKSFTLNELLTPLESIEDDEVTRREEFYKKRRQYNQAEFTIAKQQIMSREIPEPGPSIENWNFEERKAVSSPSLRLFMSQSTLLPHHDSTVNLETLRRIARQARHYQSQ